MDPLRHLSPAQLFDAARRLRRTATPAERHAWSLLRHRRVLWLKFRRQHVRHGFVVDFYCAAGRLVLELEGEPHQDPAQAGYDAARVGFLRAAGYRVARVRNREVTRGSIEAIVRAALGNAPIVPLFPKGEGARG
jgi:very-short-patch-repair endonuclease